MPKSIPLPAATSSYHAQHFWDYVDKSGGPEACWPWTRSRDGNGYGKLKLEGRTNVRASRMAYALANKRDPGELMVCHRCDNPPCCNPAHLFLGTNSENIKDCVKKGRMPNQDQSGANNGAAKLTADQVEFIKSQIHSGRNNKEIAAQFGVTHQLISRIRRGKSWGGEQIGKPYQSLRSA